MPSDTTKELKPGNKLGFCDIDCRRDMQLSTPRHRTGTPLRTQEPLFNAGNYQNHSRRLEKLHRKYGHLVNSCSYVSLR